MASKIGPVQDLWLTAAKEPTTRHGRGKRWRVNWTADGELKSKSFDKKNDAEVYRRELTTDLTIGKYVDEKAAQTTVGALWVRWSAMDGGITQRTKESRDDTWRKHVKPQWATKAVGDITRPKVSTWIAEMKKANTGVPTIEKAVGVLRGILDLAIDENRAVANAATGVKVGKRGTKPRPYLTVPQVEALARAAERVHVKEPSDKIDPQAGLVIRTLAYTGLRWGELAALRVTDVDLLRRRLHVHRAITEATKGVLEGNPKDHERRWVPIPSTLTVPLSVQVTGKGRDDYLFTSRLGGVLLVSNFRPRVFNKARAAVADLPALTPHDLRHTYASLAVSAGANVKALQRALGHSKASQTLDCYSDLYDGDLDAVAVGLNRLIKGGARRSG